MVTAVPPYSQELKVSQEPSMVADSRSLSLPGRIAASPGRVFAGFLALHAAVWTALPALLYPNLPLDLIEALIYGREWQLGYDKLPPLPWWLVEIANLTIGHDFAYYLLAQVAVVAGFAATSAPSVPASGTLGALVAVLIIDGLHYVNYTAAKFNHDVIQLPLWALAGFALHRALRGGEIRHWLLLGLSIGLSLWAKYFVVVLAAPMAVLIFIDTDARKCLKTPGPYVALAVALVVMARRALDDKRLARIGITWAIVFSCLALAFIGNYAVLPRFDHRYRAVFFPGGDLGRELSQRYRAITGKPIVYVIGSMWDGGNVAHYAPEHPRVLIDGKPERAPWIDLNDLRARGALVVWTEGDLKALPMELRNIAADAAVQPPFLVPFRRGDQTLNVGWAILLPRPSYADAD